MSLTKDDLQQIGIVVTEVTEPRFDKLEDDIESLARMTQEQFMAHDARFDRIDGRIEGIDGRLTRVESTLHQIDNRLGRVEDDVTVVKDMVKDHSFRLTRLEHKGA